MNTHPLPFPSHAQAQSVAARKANTARRDSEFLDFYNKVLGFMIENKSPRPGRHAAEWALMNGSPRYHVSYDRCMRVVQQLLRQPAMPMASSTVQGMYCEIAQRVRELMQCTGCSVSSALSFVLENCRASRYWLKPSYAYDKLPAMRRGRRRQVVARAKRLPR